MIEERLKDERKRLGFNQEEFAAFAGVTRRPYADWEAGKTSPTALQLSALAAIGVDVMYIITGQRQGQGIGESAVHQAVLDAVDLLSLGKKIDADQLARAVVKLAAKSIAPVSVPVFAVAGNVGQQINTVTGGDFRIDMSKNEKAK
ncbi:MAG: helix-turn-helix transcriptional regulator [Proteobacteria bacterium]|nr:helix-turn-helix transcriptional regulator [Pseudomonadota bacterium]